MGHTPKGLSQLQGHLATPLQETEAKERRGFSDRAGFCLVALSGMWPAGHRWVGNPGGESFRSHHSLVDWGRSGGVSVVSSCRWLIGEAPHPPPAGALTSHLPQPPLSLPFDSRQRALKAHPTPPVPGTLWFGHPADSGSRFVPSLRPPSPAFSPRCFLLCQMGVGSLQGLVWEC